MASAIPNRTPATAPCQRKCNSVQPSVATSAARVGNSNPFIAYLRSSRSPSNGSPLSLLLVLPVLQSIQERANLVQLLRLHALGASERLQHQLRTRTVEGAIDQLARELTLRLLTARGRAINVRAL